MPEAVIVATGRTPIGRANKGSLVTCRPDDLAALVVKEVLAKVPAARPRRWSRTSCMGCGQPGGRGRLQRGPGGRPPGRAGRARGDRQPLLLLVAADHPHGRPRHQGGRGRRLRGRRGGDGEPLPVRRIGHRPPQPAVRRRRGPHHGAGPGGHRAVDAAARACPTSTSPWARRPRTWPSTRRSTREEMDEFAARSQNRAVESQEQRLLRARDHPRHPGRRHRRHQGRRAPGRHHRRGARRS